MGAPLNFARHSPEQAMLGGPCVLTRRQHVRAHRGQGGKLRNDQRGLTYAATPANDFICGTLHLAVSMDLQAITTGSGTP